MNGERSIEEAVLALGGDAAYRRCVSGTPLLTAEEEREYAEACVAARKAKEAAGACPQPGPGYAEALKAGEEARQKLICGNLRLVRSVAKQFAGRMEQEDLIQEGSLGLMHAVDRYDPSYGYRFSTYAYYWIRQAMDRAVTDTSRLVRYPAHIHGSLRKYRRLCAEYSLDGMTPPDAVAAEKLHMDVEKIAKLRSLAEDPVSLNTPVGSDKDAELGDLIEDRRYKDPDEALIEDEHRKIVADTLSAVLTPKERQVITRRFGLGESRPMTLEETGRELGFSRERARQLERSALKKMNRYIVKNYGLLSGWVMEGGAGA